MKAATQQLPRLTEEQWQEQLVELARLLGWERIAHFGAAWTQKGYRTPTRLDAKGFPDLLLVGHGRLLFIECKAERGRTSAEQRAWIEALRDAGQEVHVFRPSDAEHVERVLRP